MTRQASRILCAALACALAMLPHSAPAATNGTLEIPVILSLTGTAAFVGQEETLTLGIIQDAVNTGGGIHGKAVKFAIEDDQSSPQLGVQLVNTLIAAHVPVILGPTFTSVCAAVVPLLENGPVSYCYSPGIHPTSGSYVFSADHDAGIALAHYLRGKGLNRIGFIASTDSSGQDFERGFDQTLAQPENSALHIVGREHFATADLSVVAQMTRLKAVNPQVLLTWTTGTGFGTVLRAAHDIGFDIPTIGGNGNMIPKQLAQYKSFLPRELYFAGFRATSEKGTAPGPVRDKQRVYFAGMRKLHADISYSSQADWDATLIVLDGYRKLGLTPTAQQMRDFIRGQRGWVGIEGIYDFSDPEQRGLNFMANVIDRFDPATNTFVPVSRPGGAPL